MKKINLLAIRIDGGTQARVALDQAVVTEYAEHMKDGDKFPPIIVFNDGSEYWLADGFHRYFATKANGMVSIEAEVKEGTQRDATLYSFGANGRRGLNINFEDKRNIIKRMLEDQEWGQWTNAQIAKHVGVSKMTVVVSNNSWRRKAKATTERPRSTSTATATSQRSKPQTLERKMPRKLSSNKSQPRQFPRHHSLIRMTGFKSCAAPSMSLLQRTPY